MGELKNKIILVTGASRGIGKSIAQICAREGATIIASSRTLKANNDFIKSLPNQELDHSTLTLDVAKPEDIENAFKFILSKYGRLDGLVNNAGVDFTQPFLETSLNDWHRLLDINISSVFLLSQLAIKAMLKNKKGGAIVNISSVHTFATYSGSGPYAASKGAMKMLTKALTCEFAKETIRINTVSPGLTRTDIWEDHIKLHGSEEEALKHWSKNIPSGKLVEPEEVGELTSFMLSDRAYSINGTEIYIDGGMTAQLISGE